MDHCRMKIGSQLRYGALGKISYELKIVPKLPADERGWAAFSSSGLDIWQASVWVTWALNLVEAIGRGTAHLPLKDPKYSRHFPRALHEVSQGLYSL